MRIKTIVVTIQIRIIAPKMNGKMLQFMVIDVVSIITISFFIYCGSGAPIDAQAPDAASRYGHAK